MAGFLRRKTKTSDAISPTKQPVSISPPSSTAQPPTLATPLFARFASTLNGSPGTETSGGTRIVSSPMVLSGNVRRENTTGGSPYRGGASSASISSNGRQKQQPPPPTSFQQLDERPVISRTSLDKPLPPSASDARRLAGRGHAPVTQVKQPLRSRTSFTVPDDKPLPIPGQQAQQMQPRRGPPPLTGRNLSLQASFQPTPQYPTSSTIVTNLLDDEFGDLAPQAPTPRGSVYGGGAMAVGGSGGEGGRRGYAGNGRRSVEPEYRPPSTFVDIPPEIALYQELGTVSSSPPNSGRVVAAPPRLVPTRSTPTTSAATPNFLSASPPRTTNSTANMGNSNSVLSASQSLYPAAIGPLASRTFMDTATPGHSISPHFNLGSSPSKSRRTAGYGSSPSPPPPPSPAPPVVSYVQDGYSKQLPQQQQQTARSNGRTKHNPPPPAPFVNVATSNNIQAPAPLIKGPRIFAAMAAVDNGNQSPDMLQEQQRPNPTPPPPSFLPNNQQQLRPKPSMSSVHQRETLYYDAPPPPPPQNGYYTQQAPPPQQTPSYLPTPPMQQYDPPPPQPPSPPRVGQVDYLRTPRPRGASPRPLPDPTTYTYPGPSSTPSSASNSIRRVSVRAGHPLPIPPVPAPPATPPQSPPRKKLSKTRPQQLEKDVQMQQHWPNGSASSLVSGESASASWHSASGHSQPGYSQHGHGGGGGGSGGGAGSQLGHPSPSMPSFQHNVHVHGGHRTLAKTSVPAPGGAEESQLGHPSPSIPSFQHNVHVHGGHRTLGKTSVPPPEEHPYEQPAQVDEETMRKAGIPLDDDPFAKAEGVRMLSPTSNGGAAPSSLNGVASSSTLKDSTTIKRPKSSKGESSAVDDAAEKGTVTTDMGNGAADVATDVQPVVVETPAEKKAREKEERRRLRRERKAREKEEKAREAAAAAAAALQAASGASQHTSSLDDEPAPEPIVGDELAALNGRASSPYPPSQRPEDENADAGHLDTTIFPLAKFASNPQLLANLLSYFSFWDWCILSSVTREIRILLVQKKELREEVLERYLRTVGYSRWAWSEEREPLSLSLQDLADYMRGVSTPSHEYARVAKMYVHSLTMHPDIRDPSLEHTVRCLTASARAYTRVMLRLRAQAEKEASLAGSSSSGGRSGSTPPSASIRNGLANGGVGGTNGYHGGMISRPGSRATSRAPSPAMSNFSHSHSHGTTPNMTYPGAGSSSSTAFRSPLFRLRRAPLLRVFVPSPEGDWLSDTSVLECEEECKRAGVMHLMRMGDVVWDIAVGDEGNVGRLVYDGKYLIDLDYTWNPIGDLPKYIPALAFPPSYFHRVIRTGVVTSNPVVHVDISPWGEEIAANLQLLQDRVKTETPQGAYHNVVRWVHRSSFVIRPPARVMQRGPSINGRGQPHTPRIAIPDTDNLFIDSGWYGTIVVETEGTNEALADLQERCGPRAFPPRPRPLNPAQQKAQQEVKKVFRILREKSRPGEIWIKAVGIKERIL